jgi:hypothetical protein
LSTDLIEFCDGTIVLCASQFYRFSREQLRCVDKQILQDLLGSPFLRLDSEDSLFEMIDDLGKDYSDLWVYLNISLLSEQSFLHFLDIFRFDNMTRDIWLNVVERLRGVPDDSIRTDRHRLCSFSNQSTILRNLPLILKEFWEKKWTLLYRGTVDGFSTSSFHTKCDGHGNTITIIRTTNDCIFGGFTPSVWHSKGSDIPDESGTSFIFSVTNPHKKGPMRFPLSNKSCAIYGHSGYGPIFGSGYDIYVTYSSNATSLGGSYVNDTGIDGKQVLAGECNFTMKEMEVISINL